ncbi:MAG: hypothetical protein ABIA76_00865 [Candidatus Diapherotrites archaeon]
MYKKFFLFFFFCFLFISVFAAPEDPFGLPLKEGAEFIEGIVGGVFDLVGLAEDDPITESDFASINLYPDLPERIDLFVSNESVEDEVIFTLPLSKWLPSYSIHERLVLDGVGKNFVSFSVEDFSGGFNDPNNPEFNPNSSFVQPTITFSVDISDYSDELLNEEYSLNLRLADIRLINEEGKMIDDLISDGIEVVIHNDFCLKEIELSYGREDLTEKEFSNALLYCRLDRLEDLNEKYLDLLEKSLENKNAFIEHNSGVDSYVWLLLSDEIQINSKGNCRQYLNYFNSNFGELRSKNLMPSFNRIHFLDSFYFDSCEANMVYSELHREKKRTLDLITELNELDEFVVLDFLNKFDLVFDSRLKHIDLFEASGLISLAFVSPRETLPKKLEENKKIAERFQEEELLESEKLKEMHLSEFMDLENIFGEEGEMNDLFELKYNFLKTRYDYLENRYSWKNIDSFIEAEYAFNEKLFLISNLFDSEEEINQFNEINKRMHLNQILLEVAKKEIQTENELFKGALGELDEQLDDRTSFAKLFYNGYYGLKWIIREEENQEEVTEILNREEIIHEQQRQFNILVHLLDDDLENLLNQGDITEEDIEEKGYIGSARYFLQSSSIVQNNKTADNSTLKKFNSIQEIINEHNRAPNELELIELDFAEAKDYISESVYPVAKAKLLELEKKIELFNEENEIILPEVSSLSLKVKSELHVLEFVELSSHRWEAFFDVRYWFIGEFAFRGVFSLVGVVGKSAIKTSLGTRLAEFVSGKYAQASVRALSNIGRFLEKHPFIEFSLRGTGRLIKLSIDKKNAFKAVLFKRFPNTATVIYTKITPSSVFNFRVALSEARKDLLTNWFRYEISALRNLSKTYSRVPKEILTDFAESTAKKIVVGGVEKDAVVAGSEKYLIYSFNELDDAFLINLNSVTPKQLSKISKTLDSLEDLIEFVSKESPEEAAILIKELQFQKAVINETKGVVCKGSTLEACSIDEVETLFLSESIQILKEEGVVFGSKKLYLKFPGSLSLRRTLPAILPDQLQRLGSFWKQSMARSGKQNVFRGLSSEGLVPVLTSELNDPFAGKIYFYVCRSKPSIGGFTFQSIKGGRFDSIAISLDSAFSWNKLSLFRSGKDLVSNSINISAHELSHIRWFALSTSERAELINLFSKNRSLIKYLKKFQTGYEKDYFTYSFTKLDLYQANPSKFMPPLMSEGKIVEINGKMIDADTLMTEIISFWVYGNVRVSSFSSEFVKKAYSKGLFIQDEKIMKEFAELILASMRTKYVPIQLTERELQTAITEYFKKRPIIYPN